jgi:hypothetical protein
MPFGSITLGEDHEVPLNVNASPELPTATQKLGEEHDTEVRKEGFFPSLGPLRAIETGADHETPL